MALDPYDNAEEVTILLSKGRNYLLVAFMIPLLLLFYCVSALSLWFAGDILSDAYRDEGLSGVAILAMGYPILIGFSVAMTLSTIKLFKRNSQTMPALVVTKEGLEGYGFFKRKKFCWRDIKDIYEYKNTLKIIRRSDKTLPYLIRVFLLGFDDDEICVPIGFINTDKKDLYRVLRRFAPPGELFSR